MVVSGCLLGVQVWFGPAVRSIVEGETKFSKIGQLGTGDASSADVKAHDLQHLFLAMTKEASCARHTAIADSVLYDT